MVMFVDPGAETTLSRVMSCIFPPDALAIFIVVPKHLPTAPGTIHRGSMRIFEVGARTELVSILTAFFIWDIYVP